MLRRPLRRTIFALGLAVLVAAAAILIYESRPTSAGSGPVNGSVNGSRPAMLHVSSQCTRTAHSAGDLNHEYGAAEAGDTICLTSGDYATFAAGQKDGPVGVRAAPGANVRIALKLDSVRNLRVDDVTVTSAQISGTSRDITIAHSRFTGLAVVLTDKMVNANIVFAFNVHADVNTCASCYQGRVHVEGTSGRPAGVLVRDSVFSGGNSDGVRADADDVQIIDNEFFGLRDKDPFHTDPIQLYGGSHVVIRGNWFHDNAVSAQIMMADGGSDNVVEDNVISGDGYTFAITWYSDVGSVIRHNTFSGGTCNANVICGTLNLGSKPDDPPGRGTVIRDNVIGGISSDPKLSRYTADHNLTATTILGDDNVKGLPQFRGPETAFRGYRLAPGSPGSGKGSGGADPGIT